MYLQRFPSFKEMEQTETDLSRKTTDMHKIALNARSLFASAAGCIKNKRTHNVTACLNTEINFC